MAKKPISDTVAIARIEKTLAGFSVRERIAILNYLAGKTQLNLYGGTTSPLNEAAEMIRK